MIHHDHTNWTKLESMRGLLFFIQRVEELTYPFTLDSYKSPTMSTPGLFREGLLTIANRSKDISDEKVLNQVSHIIDEIRYRLKGNWIAKNISTIEIESHLPSQPILENIDQIYRNLDMIHSELNIEHYIGYIVSEVIRLAPDSKNKYKLDFLAKEFVSLIQHQGVSREYINYMIKEFFWTDKEISSPDDFNDFCKLVFPHDHKFTVLIGGSGALVSMDKQFLRQNGIDVFKNKTVKDGETVEHLEGFSEESGHDWVCSVNVMATDYFSAITDARQIVEQAFSYFAIFNHKENLQISDKPSL